MSDIGDDLSEVLAEIGSRITIFKYATREVTSGYIDPEDKVDRGAPFASEYFLKCSIPYDSTMEESDIVTLIDRAGTPEYIVAMLQEMDFESSTIIKEGILYKSNAVAVIKRKSQSRDSDLNLITTWPRISGCSISGEPVLFTGLITGITDRMPGIVTSDKEQGTFISEENIMFISKGISILEKDRLLLKETKADASGELFEIQVIEKYKFPGVYICQVREDVRE